MASVLIQHADGIPEPSNNSAGQDLYFEVLELQPIKLSLSFMRTERVNSDEKYFWTVLLSCESLTNSSPDLAFGTLWLSSLTL